MTKGLRGTKFIQTFKYIWTMSHAVILGSGEGSDEKM